MKLVIFGASGHIGRVVVVAALERGHQVTVLVHNKSPFTESAQLKIIKGDVHQTGDVEKAVAGCDAVISTLGSLRGPAKDVLSSAMQRVIPALQKAGDTRIVTLTGNSAFASFDSPTPREKVVRAFLGAIAPKVLRDAEDHIQLLQDSSLKWSVLRAPVILKSGKASYQLNKTSPKPWQTIPRDAVAMALLDLVESKNYLQQAPFIHRK